MKYHLYMVVLLNTFCNGEKAIRQGHFGKLGDQKSPTVSTTVLHSVPQSQIFYEEFVKENRPVVFRGAATRSRAFHKWTEEYLKKEYGNLTVRLEARAEDNSKMPVGAIGLGLDLLGNFIDKYHDIDGYIISQIPEPMEKDVMILPCLRCGSFAKSIQEVHLFLSASGGKTALHKDPYNNIHCIFNGTKDWITIHPNQTDLLYMSPDSEYEWGGLSEINVDEVDLDQYPNIAKLEYSKIRLHKGDCIFMPSGYWHQVRSWGYLNSAVAIWFSIVDKFDSTGCSESVHDFTPLNEVNILWRYSGAGNLTQGHMDIYILQKALLLWADEKGIIRLNSFVENVFTLMDYNQERRAMVLDLQSRKSKFLEYLDRGSKGYTTVDIVDKLSVTQLKELVELIHPNDISNTDMFEYGHIAAEDIRNALFEAFGSDGKFNKNGFFVSYTQELGGTAEKAEKIMSDLQNLGLGIVSVESLELNADKILNRYLNALTHDAATEKRIYQLINMGKKSLSHDEL